MGALINKNTFEEGRLFERGGALIERRALNRIITVLEYPAGAAGRRKSSRKITILPSVTVS